METDFIDLKKLRYAKPVTLPLCSFTERRNLFDNPSSKLLRFIKVSWLDSHIDTEADFKLLLRQMHDVGTIVIIDDREKCNNSIYKAYSKEMLKSYIRAFLDSGISCFWKK